TEEFVWPENCARCGRLRNDEDGTAHRFWRPECRVAPLFHVLREFRFAACSHTIHLRPYTQSSHLHVSPHELERSSLVVVSAAGSGACSGASAVGAGMLCGRI